MGDPNKLTGKFTGTFEGEFEPSDTTTKTVIGDGGYTIHHGIRHIPTKAERADEAAENIRGLQQRIACYRPKFDVSDLKKAAKIWFGDKDYAEANAAAAKGNTRCYTSECPDFTGDAKTPGDQAWMNSKFFRTVLKSGRIFSPYLVRFKLYRQFFQLWAAKEGNIQAAVRDANWLGDKYQMEWLIDECNRIAKMEDTNRPEAEDRKKTFTLAAAKAVYLEYLERVWKIFTDEETRLGWRRENDAGAAIRDGKTYVREYRVYLPRFGSIVCSTASATERSGGNTADVHERVGDGREALYRYCHPELETVNTHRDLAHKIEEDLCALKKYLGWGRRGDWVNTEKSGLVPIRNKAFRELFLLQGAYYVLTQLVELEGVTLVTASGTIPCAANAIKFLRGMRDRGEPAYKFLAILKLTLASC